MNDVIFGFVALPIYLCFVFLVFTLVFGRDIYRSLYRIRVAHWANRQRKAPIPTAEGEETTRIVEPTRPTRERELVHH